MSGVRACSMLSLTSLHPDRDGWRDTLGNVGLELSHLEPLADETRERLQALDWSEQEQADFKFAHSLSLGCFFDMRRQYDDAVRQLGRVPSSLTPFQWNDGDRNPYPPAD